MSCVFGSSNLVQHSIIATNAARWPSTYFASILLSCVLIYCWWQIEQQIVSKIIYRFSLNQTSHTLNQPGVLNWCGVVAVSVSVSVSLCVHHISFIIRKVRVFRRLNPVLRFFFLFTTEYIDQFGVRLITINKSALGSDITETYVLVRSFVC